MHILVTCKYKKDRIKNNREKVETSFSHYKSRGLSVAMGTRVLILSAPKAYAAFPPPPLRLHINFDQDWPTGLRDIQVWKYGRRRTDDDGRTDDGPLVYYKLNGFAEIILAKME